MPIQWLFNTDRKDMGKGWNSIISGTLGRIVIANVNDVEISRVRPKKSDKPPSITQLMHRAKFKFCVEFLSGYPSVSKKYFGILPGLVTRYKRVLSKSRDSLKQR